MLHKRLVAIFGGLSAFIGLAAIGSTVIVNKPDGVRDGDLARYAAILRSIEERKQLKAMPNTSSPPKAYVKSRSFDFGMIAPGTFSAEHNFVIENHGQSPLLVEEGPTSCKCTVSKIENPIVHPGRSTAIKVVWNVGSETSESFSQVAVVKTNDPENAEIELTVAGRVAAKWLVEADLIGSSDDRRGRISASTRILSQVFKDVVVVETETSLTNIDVSAEVIDVASEIPPSFKSGIRVKAIYSPEEGNGVAVDATVKVLLMDAESGEREWLEIPFRGRYRSQVSFFAPEIWSRGGFHLGLIKLGSKPEWKVGVRVRGNDVVDDLIVTDVRPSSLKAELKLTKSLKNTYQLVIGLAEDAKHVRFLDQHDGYIEVRSASNPGIQGRLPIQGQIVNAVAE